MMNGSHADSLPRHAVPLRYVPKRSNNEGMFTDRADAGRRLAAALRDKGYTKPLVLALPRGGVPVGYEVAKELDCPLDTLVVRKVGTPFNPEFAVGAIAPHDVVLFDDLAIKTSGASRSAVEGIEQRERQELRRRIDAYRSGTYAASYIPGTVMLVDDGIATGLSARAAVAAARARYPKARIVVAVPVCIGALDELKREADEIVCLSQIDHVHAISEAYETFDQVSDAEVISRLSRK